MFENTKKRRKEWSAKFDELEGRGYVLSVERIPYVVGLLDTTVSEMKLVHSIENFISIQIESKVRS